MTTVHLVYIYVDTNGHFLKILKEVSFRQRCRYGGSFYVALSVTVSSKKLGLEMKSITVAQCVSVHAGGARRSCT